jgi:hypothetical protein
MTKPELPTPPCSGRHAPTILYEALQKPSNPIEIPTRRRPILSPTFSPINRPLSPELIFEMSPINSSSTDSIFLSDCNAHYYPFVQRSLKSRPTPSMSTSKSPPFMYPFPRPTAHHKQQVKPDNITRSQSPKFFSSSALPISCSLSKSMPYQERHSIDHTPQYHCLTSAFESELENSVSENRSQVGLFSAPSSRGRTRHRSSKSGHVSALGSPPSVRIHSQRGLALISRPQVSPPSLLLCGDARKLVLDDTSSKEVEPVLEAEVGLFDIGFGKHLMRTEDEKHVSVGRSRVVSSVQVSYGT